METIFKHFSTILAHLSPTRLEGMETNGAGQLWRGLERSPTRLEGMETPAATPQTRERVVSDPP